MHDLRSPLPSDTPALLKIAANSGLFDPHEAEALLGRTLTRFHASSLPAGHTITVAATSDDDVLGWTYLAPDEHADRVWNFWWIGVAPARHGSDVATALLRRAETVAREAGSRILVVETSDGEALGRARRFYAREGYSDCGRVPDFYALGEAKIVFCKRLLSPAVVDGH